jgi:hypothetical protein
METKSRLQLAKMWAPVLDAEVDGIQKITSSTLRESTSQILENTFGMLKKQGLNEEQLLEAFDNSDSFDLKAAGAADTTAVGANNLTANANWNSTDQRLLMAALPLARRMFTQLLAHQLVGVQPMNGPTGYATCLRHVYGSGADKGKEMVFDTFNAAFSGTTEQTGTPGAANVGSPAANKWFGTPSGADGWSKAAGKWVQNAEDVGFSNGGSPAVYGLARGKMKLEKALLEAKSRAIATSYSIEDAEDLMAIQGINVNSELVAILGNEIKNEIDREFKK